MNKYKFLDIGCKQGGSFDIGYKFGYKKNEGLCLDINEKNIKKSDEKGFNTILMDATKMEFASDSFELVILSHVLEHMPTKDDYYKVLNKSLDISSKYVFISFPFFDEDEYLNSLGLKTFYSNWIGHTCMMHLKELKEYLKDYEYDLQMVKLLTDSSYPEIHPLSSPVDQHEYDKSKHPPKPQITFDRPIYREFKLIVKKELI